MINNEFNLSQLQQFQQIRTYMMQQVDRFHKAERLNQKSKNFYTHLTEQIKELNLSLCSLYQQYRTQIRDIQSKWEQVICALSQHYSYQLQNKNQQIERLNCQLLRIKQNYMEIQRQVDVIIRDQSIQRATSASRIKNLQQKLAECICGNKNSEKPLQKCLDVISQKDEQSYKSITQSNKQLSMDFTQYLQQGIELQQKRYICEQQINKVNKKKGRFIILDGQGKSVTKKCLLNKSIHDQIQNKIQIKEPKYSSKDSLKASSQSRKSSFNKSSQINNNNNKKLISIKINIPKTKTKKHPLSQQIYGINSSQISKIDNKYQILSKSKYKTISSYGKGITYQGQFHNQKRHGFGILKKDGIQIYHGNWKNDMFNGQGRLKNIKNLQRKKFPNQAGLQYWIYYSGSFKDNLFDGIGSMVLANGDKFIGKFVQGTADGQGTLFYKDGRQIHGIWQNNELVQQN